MENSVESALIFDDYSVNDMCFKRNHDYEGSNEIELNFGFNAEAYLTEKKDKAKLIITCTIFEEEFKQGLSPFYLDISMTGHFSCEGDIDIEGFQMNGMAILLPYLRSLITSFTAQSGIPPVILPPINVYNVFKRK